MTRDKINQKIEAARKKHGDYNDGKLILLRNTYHECAPGHDYLWCAEAVYLDTKKNEAWIVPVYWDFEDFVEKNGDRDDASDYPWEMEPDFDLGPAVFYNLSLQDDCEDLLNELNNWI